MNEYVDLECLNPWINDPQIEDIMYNNEELWITHQSLGHLRCNVTIPYINIEKIAHQLSHNMGVLFNSSHPILDAEYNHLRINAIHESLTGSTKIVLNIRKTPFSLMFKEDYSTPIEVLELLKALIDARCNVMIAGETGAGKTEFLKYLVGHIRKTERIITIEDTLEAHLKTIYSDKDIVSLKMNHRIDAKDLIRTCLRQRPNWILVSESRGKEVKEMIQSVATGHSIITTIHAPSAKAIPLRLINLMVDSNEQSDGLLDTIHSLIPIGIYIHKTEDEMGIKRQLYEIVEFTFDSKQQPICNTIYKYHPTQPLFSKLSTRLIEQMELRATDTSKIGIFL